MAEYCLIDRPIKIEARDVMEPPTGHETTSITYNCELSDMQEKASCNTLCSHTPLSQADGDKMQDTVETSALTLIAQCYSSDSSSDV